MQIDQQAWDSFVASTPGGSFLQSWEWGLLQEKLQIPHWRLHHEQDNVLTGVALVVKRELPMRRSWLYIPRGPLWEASSVKNQKPNNSLMRQLTDLAEKERAVFVRSEPANIPGDAWRKAERDVQPRHTIMVELTKSEEDLLAAMHQKARYNIRLAEKRGVSVRFSTEAADIDHFLRLSREVHDRSTFRYHPEQYYHHMRNVLSPAGMFEIAVAEHAGDILAVHLLTYFGDTVTYVHGASSSLKRNLMAPHLLQWRSITRAKERGYHWYDFFGVAPKDATASHFWSGITKFKEGFGGTRVEYPGAYDLVLDSTGYWVYNTGRKLKGFLR